MSIKIEHRNLEIRKKFDGFFVQVRNFLLPLSLKVLQHKERETQSFYSVFFLIIWNMCGTSPRPPRASESQPSSPKAVNSLSSSSKNPPRTSGVWRHSLSPALVSHLGLLWHLWVTRPLCPHARAWTPVLMLHLTNPCAEPKGSQPN